MINLEQRRQRIETIVKVLLALAIAFFVSPIIFATIKGLIGAAIALFLGYVAIAFAPVVARLIANWRLKALKAVVAANPIENLEEQYQEKQEALLKFRESIQEFNSVVQQLWDQIQEHNQNFPGKPSQFMEKYKKMSQLLVLRGEKYKKAQRNLADFAELIKEKRSDWKIAQSAAKASKLANVGEDFQSQLIKDTALSTIQDGLNMAFSELEVSLLDEQSTAAPTVEVSPANEKSVAAIPEKCGPPKLDLDFDAPPVIEAESVPVVQPKRNRRNN